jgi:putative Mn2+ efflux pump MntP
MSFFVILTIAIAMAMDTFAVAIGLSLSRQGLDGRQRFRLAFHFGLFQFLMPVLGWIAGRTLLSAIESFDHWIAAGLLVFVGGKMIVEFIRQDDKDEAKNGDVTRGGSLVVLSLATSMDALAVGLSFGALGVPVVYPAVIIGVVTFIITMIGTLIGPVLGKLVGRWAELGGGLVLLAIAVKILVEHLGK